MELSEHYRAQRARVTELVRTLSAEQLETNVPGCPKWTVREVLSHLTGLSADVTAGRVEGAGTPPWTAVQVADRQGKGVDELIAEWEVHGPELEAQLDGMGGIGRALVMDVTMHEDDIREALGLPLGDSETHAFVVDALANRAGQKIGEAGLPALRLATPGRSWTAGEGEPAVAVEAADDAQLARALGGRRSEEGLRALDWTGDPGPYLPHLPLFQPGG